jgi:lipopolysaccharide heptosyltransferase II
VNRILIVNVNWVGDVLFSTPLIKGLRKKFPKGYIACMIPPRCREALELNPHLNEIIIYDEDGLHRSPFGKLRLISALRSGRFDAAILLHRSFTRSLMVFMAGIPRRIGYQRRRRDFLVTDAVELPPEDAHRVDFFMNLGRPLGIATDDRNYEFFISDNDRKKAKGLLESEGIADSDKLVAINPGGNWNPKRWPVENFAEAADGLMEQHNAKIIISGAAKDMPLANDIASRMKQRPAISCGKTTLKQAAAIFERSNLVIANDSGPMHIAVAMGTPTIALFGPTSPEITGPLGRGRCLILHEDVGCEIPCYNLSCVQYRCMKAIRPGDILKAAGDLLS